MNSAPELVPASPRVTSFFDFSAPSMTGGEVPLEQYRGKVVLAVNTASRCLFTRQFEELQALQSAYEDRGFTVLGFPSGQFRQELETDAEVEEFCTSAYDVTFPLFSTIDVNGRTAHPLFSWLQTQKGGIVGGRIAWNFTKFLISADGQVLRRYAPPVPPRRIARRIEEELAESSAQEAPRPAQEPPRPAQDLDSTI